MRERSLRVRSTPVGSRTVVEILAGAFAGEMVATGGALFVDRAAGTD
jgi:hypothetical protein